MFYCFSCWICRKKCAKCGIFGAKKNPQQSRGLLGIAEQGLPLPDVHDSIMVVQMDVPTVQTDNLGRLGTGFPST